MTETPSKSAAKEKDTQNFQRFEHFVRSFFPQCDLGSLTFQLASLLSSEDFHVSLASSVLVDVYFNNVVYAIQHNFTPRATHSFLEDCEEFRKGVISEASSEDLKALFESVFLPHTKQVESVIPPPVATPHLEAEEVKPQPKKPAKKGKVETAPPPPPVDPEPVVVIEHVHLSCGEVASIAEYLFSWMVQHRNLFRFVFSGYERPTEKIATFKVSVEIPAPPVDLSKALTEAAFLEVAAKKIVKMQLETHAEAVKEEEVIVAAKREELTRLEDEKSKKLTPEVTSETSLTLSNVEAKRHVENLSGDVLHAFSTRQQKLLDRIDAVSRKLGI